MIKLSASLKIKPVVLQNRVVLVSDKDTANKHDDSHVITLTSPFLV